MVWEIAAAIIGLIPLAHWICIDRRYTAMIGRLAEIVVDVEKGMMGSGFGGGREVNPYWRKTRTVKSLREIGKTCRYMGRRGLLIICAMSFAGAVVIGMINTDPIFKWTVFMVCAAPIYNTILHFRNIFGEFMQFASSAIDAVAILPRR